MLFFELYVRLENVIRFLWNVKYRISTLYLAYIYSSQLVFLYLSNNFFSFFYHFSAIKEIYYQIKSTLSVNTMNSNIYLKQKSYETICFIKTFNSKLDTVVGVMCVMCSRLLHFFSFFLSNILLY